MKKLPIIGAALLLSFASSASASLSFIDAAGNSVAAPAVLDSSHEAIYFTETANGVGGQYTVTNNTVDYGLLAFGISNFETISGVGDPFSSFGCSGDSDSNWCYQSGNLNQENWDIAIVDFQENTGMDLFGNIANVLDPGDNTLNFYVAADGELITGDSWDGFYFSSGLPSSQLFVVLGGPSGTIYASGGQPVNAVPLPAGIWLLLSGLAGLLSVARRKKE